MLNDCQPREDLTRKRKKSAEGKDQASSKEPEVLLDACDDYSRLSPSEREKGSLLQILQDALCARYLGSS
jgi:hypothetical protein